MSGTRARCPVRTAVTSTDYASSLESLEGSVLNYPDYVVFDIDPYIYSGKEKAGDEPELNTIAFEKGKEVAFWLRELLHGMSLEPIVKTSGKTGLHVFVPIKRTIDFDAAREISELVGRHLMRQHPKDITMEWSVPKRTGKIFMDYNMNVRGKTLNVAYSPRGASGAPISMPLTWDELAGAHPLDFRITNVGERLAKGDRWRDALKAKQSLERAVKELTPHAVAERQTTREEGMAARSIGSLTIAFGLVSIPAKMFSATEASKAISFNMLHKDCGSRLKQQYLCLKEEIPVAREDIVKGYEFAKDQYVMFTPEELKALEEAGTQTAEITEFVPIESIDPVYFDKAYYLAPDKGGAKPYALLTRALRESGRCAVGRYAARGKQYIVMLRPIEGGLVMQQLLYAAEVRSISDIEIPQTEVKDVELKLAQQLIEQQASDTFDPTVYTDDVRARVEAAVQKKVEGQEITMAEVPESGGAQVIDLMEALRASLNKKTTAPAKSSAPEAPARETRKPAKRAAQVEPAARKAARK